MGRRTRFSDVERQQKASRYGLTGVRSGSRIAWAKDRYGRWELGFREGTIVNRVGARVGIRWDGAEEVEVFDEGDVRFAVDLGRARITAPEAKDPLNPV